LKYIVQANQNKTIMPGGTMYTTSVRRPSEHMGVR